VTPTELPFATDYCVPLRLSNRIVALANTSKLEISSACAMPKYFGRVTRLSSNEVARLAEHRGFGGRDENSNAAAFDSVQWSYSI
jgi:hypothetical protein